MSKLSGLENAMARARDALSTAALEIGAILCLADGGSEVDLQSKSITSINELRIYQAELYLVTETVADMQTVLALGD